MDAYACDECGYYYDPVIGDEPNGIEPGTPFGELPKDWVCPDCGTSTERFCSIPDIDDFDEDDDGLLDEDDVY